MNSILLTNLRVRLWIPPFEALYPAIVGSAIAPLTLPMLTIA